MLSNATSLEINFTSRSQANYSIAAKGLTAVGMIGPEEEDDPPCTDELRISVSTHFELGAAMCSACSRCTTIPGSGRLHSLFLQVLGKSI